MPRADPADPVWAQYNPSHRAFAQAYVEYSDKVGQPALVPDLDQLVGRAVDKIEECLKKGNWYTYGAQFLSLRWAGLPKERDESDHGITRGLLEKAETVLKSNGLYHSRRAAGLYFQRNDGVSGFDRARSDGLNYAKIYGSIKTERALDFAGTLDDPSISRNRFEGKFYPGADGSHDHNKLCMYVPHESLAPVLGFLRAQKDMFHPIPENHPAGLQPLPGVSAVIASEASRSFDQALQDVFIDVWHPSLKTSFDFPAYEKHNMRARRIIEGKKNGTINDVLKQELILDPTVGTHFAFLERFGGRRLVRGSSKRPAAVA